MNGELPAKRPWFRHRSTILAAVLGGAVCPGFLLADDDDGEDRHGESQSGSVDRTSAELAVAWFDQIYELVRGTPGYSPPVASRAYGYCGVTIYEALVHGMRDHRSLAGQLNGLEELPRPSTKRHHWPTVGNAAMQTVAAHFFHFFPASSGAIDALAEEFFSDYAEEVETSVFERSVEYGGDLAGAIIEWSEGDGFAEIEAANEAFVPPTVDGPWIGAGKGLQPAWGGLRPFALLSPTECSVAAHPRYSEDPGSAFYAHGLVVRNTTGDLGASLTVDQRDIAHFWSDGPGDTGTPPGHWVSIMGIIATERRLSLATAAEGYARIGISVADAFITCWQTKFTHYLLRPNAYINKVIDPDWTPLLVTPNFPAYTSGHSTQSGATQAVMTDLLGKVSFTDTTHVDRRNSQVLANLTSHTRSFSSLFQAAKEAVVSRLYGGIHYIFDNEIGFEQGVCVGETIIDRIKFKEEERGAARISRPDR